MRAFTICGAILLAAVTAAAPFDARGKQGEQEKPAAPAHDMEHTNHGAGHGGFMQGGMHHADAKCDKLDAKGRDGARIDTPHVDTIYLGVPSSYQNKADPPSLLCHRLAAV